MKSGFNLYSRLILYITSFFWIIIFLDIYFGTEFYSTCFSIYQLHNAIIILLLAMSIIVPMVFVREYFKKQLKLYHYISIISWILNILTFYHEIFISRAL